MFEAASFSLCSLLVFLPLVMGGEGAEKYLGSELPLNQRKGLRNPVPLGMKSHGLTFGHLSWILKEGLEKLLS